MATTQMIRTDPTQTQALWTGLSGTILEGGYELQELLEATGERARFKVRVLGDRELDSVAHMFLLPEAEVDRQVELWGNAKLLRHPNLSGPLGAGRLQIQEKPAAYVVLRRADEALGAVLHERPLTADEAGEVLLSVSRALEALHLNGWAHGCLSPDVVLAMADSIQLPTECVRAADAAPAVQTVTAKYLAPESPEVNLTPAADLWCLGATLFEALTQKTWTEERRGELQALPEPFAAIAGRCLHVDPQTRCRLAEAVALYRGELKLPPQTQTVSRPAVVVPEQEMAALPATRPVEFPEPAAMNGPGPAEPVHQPRKATLFIEESPSGPEAFQAAMPADPEAAAAPTAATTHFQTEPADTDSRPPRAPDNQANLPQAAALAALAPEANARTVEPPSSRADRFPSPVGRHDSPASPLASRPDERQGRRRVLDEEENGSKKLWVRIGLAAIILLALVFLLRFLHRTPANTPGESRTTSLPAGEQREGGSAWQTHTVGPGAVAPVPAPHVDNGARPDAVKPNSHAQTSTGIGPASRSIWRVVLYTYNRRNEAEAKAKAVNAKHSGLHAEVFSPSGSGSPFVVAAGGRMSREEAAQMRRKAIAAGMPHDSYIQNYSR